MAYWLNAVHENRLLRRYLLIDRYRLPTLITDTYGHLLHGCEAYLQHKEKTARGEYLSPGSVRHPPEGRKRPGHSMNGWAFQIGQISCKAIRDQEVAHLQNTFNDRRRNRSCQRTALPVAHHTLALRLRRTRRPVEQKSYSGGARQREFTFRERRGPLHLRYAVKQAPAGVSGTEPSLPCASTVRHGPTLFPRVPIQQGILEATMAYHARGCGFVCGRFVRLLGRLVRSQSSASVQRGRQQ